MIVTTLTLGTWLAIVVLAPFTIGSIAALLNKRRGPSIKQTFTLALSWFRSFARVNRSRSLLLFFSIPVVFARFSLYRHTSNRMVVYNVSEDATTALTLRFVEPSSWWLADFLAWPLGAGNGTKLLERVLRVADLAGATIHLRALSSDLATAYYPRFGFELTGDRHDDKNLEMVRRPAQSPLSGVTR